MADPDLYPGSPAYGSREPSPAGPPVVPHRLGQDRLYQPPSPAGGTYTPEMQAREVERQNAQQLTPEEASSTGLGALHTLAAMDMGGTDPAVANQIENSMLANLARAGRITEHDGEVDASDMNASDAAQLHEWLLKRHGTGQ